MQLKCSGEQQGCRRCSSLRIQCEYGASCYGKRTRQTDHVGDPRNAARRYVQPRGSRHSPAATAAPITEPQKPIADADNDVEDRIIPRPLSLTDEAEDANLPWLSESSAIASTEMPDFTCDLDALLVEEDTIELSETTLSDFDHVDPFRKMNLPLGMATSIGIPVMSFPIVHKFS